MQHTVADVIRWRQSSGQQTSTGESSRVARIEHHHEVGVVRQLTVKIDKAIIRHGSLRDQAKS